MSAALQLATLWSAGAAQAAWQMEERAWECEPAARPEFEAPAEPSPEPAISLAFYRKHTERLLQRYLYASMQVGRAHRSSANLWLGDGLRAAQFAPSRTP